MLTKEDLVLIRQALFMMAKIPNIPEDLTDQCIAVKQKVVKVISQMGTTDKQAVDNDKKTS